MVAQGQVHSFNWIYAADCQGKVGASLNMVFLQKEEVKHVVSFATKSDYRLLNETVVLCYYIFHECHLKFCENLKLQAQE